MNQIEEIYAVRKSSRAVPVRRQSELMDELLAVLLRISQRHSTNLDRFYCHFETKNESGIPWLTGARTYGTFLFLLKEPLSGCKHG